MDVNKLLNTDVTGIDTEPRLILPIKHTISVIVSITKGYLTLVFNKVNLLFIHQNNSMQKAKF